MHTLRGGHLEPMLYKDTSISNEEYYNRWTYNYQHPIGMVAVTLYNDSGTLIQLCLEHTTPMHLHRRWLTVDSIPSDLSICRYCLAFLKHIN